MRNGFFAARALAAAAAFATACAVRADIDIIEYLRALPQGTNNWTCTPGAGVQLAANSAYGIFDGVYNNDSGRLLFIRRDNNGMLPANVEFTLHPLGAPETGFTVKSIVVYRIHDGSYEYIKRSSREWMLEGSTDGQSWKTLFRTPEKVTWDAATHAMTNEIPESARGCYRKYRFHCIVDAGDTEVEGYAQGIVELKLFGDVHTGNLVWNGGEGDEWDSSSENWRGDPGETTAWVPGATAVFGTGGVHEVTLAETVRTAGIDFHVHPGIHHVLSGGKIGLMRPATIVGGNDEVIHSAITNLASESAYSDSEWLPADPNDAHKGSWVTLWRNRLLSGITDFPSASMFFNGVHSAKAYNIVHLPDGSVTAQFQVFPTGSAVVCVKVAFEQRGLDIVGRVVYTAYTWAADRALGRDFDLHFDNQGNVYTGGTTSLYYGIRAITATGGDEPAPVKVEFSSQFGAGTFSGYLPAKDGDTTTGKAVKYWDYLKLDDVSGFSAATIRYMDNFYAAKAFYFTRENGVITAQFQVLPPGNALFCFKVEFRQMDDGVSARIVYVRYTWDAGRELGWDFDHYSGVFSCATGDIHDGDGPIQTKHYGLLDIYAVANGRLTLAGPMDFTGDLSIGAGGVLMLGMADYTFDRDFTGEGALGFAPVAGSQTIRVNDARTLGKVAFGGNTALVFAQGASLTADSALVYPEARVSVACASGEKPLRIGTSKCLTKAELAKFTVLGCPAKQDADGYIVPAPGTMVILR